MLWDDDAPLEELAASSDAEEFCRQLLASPWGLGSSTRYREAVDLLANVQGAGDLPASFVALLLCTHRRWDRVTARLIAGIEESGLLSDDQLDDLTESLPAASTRSTRTRSVSTAPRSSRRCAAGRRDVRCEPILSDSTTC